MTYMSDHLVKLSKCPFKFEVSRNSGKGVMYSNVHNNFLKIKLLLLFHETLCYLIDSLNLIYHAVSVDARNIFYIILYLQ